MPDDAYRIDFGKHRGMTLAEIDDADPRYLLWLLMNTKRTRPDAYSEVRSFLEAMLIRLEAERPKRTRRRHAVDNST